MAENPSTHLAKKPDAHPGQASPHSFILTLLKELADAKDWCAHNPLSSALLATILGTLYYFFAVYHPFTNGSLSTVVWAWQAWAPDGDQVYDRIVPFVGLWLAWNHRRELLSAPKQNSNWGLMWLFTGIGLFFIGSRCLQPRLTLMSVPFLIYGSVMFVWGKKVARVILFPCAFQIFLIPADTFTQATFKLQFIITGLVGAISHLLGIGIQATGTTLAATDGSFTFEIAEGCSGIRSLVAMMMLTAIYVHLTQNRLWKKITIFSASILFALIGNTGRILSIVLVAKYVNEKFAAGAYHESSGWISFPFALGAMLVFDWFINKFADTLSPSRLSAPQAGPGISPEALSTPEEASSAKERPGSSDSSEPKRPKYDY